MKYKNDSNIPEIVAQVIRDDRYSRGASDISVTGLLAPPRVTILERLYRDHIVKDVSKGFPALLGTALHAYFEDYYKSQENVVTETRMFKKIGNVTLSGQFDLFFVDSGTLADIKLTSVTNKGKPEWEQQLNVYHYLFNNHDRTEGPPIPEGAVVNTLKIIALYKDWKFSNKTVNCAQEIEYPIWDVNQQEEFIIERLNKLSAVSKALRETDPHDLQGALPKCSKAETWYNRKCKDWCDVSAFCSQWKETQRFVK